MAGYRTTLLLDLLIYCASVAFVARFFTKHRKEKNRGRLNKISPFDTPKPR